MRGPPSPPRRSISSTAAVIKNIPPTATINRKKKLFKESTNTNTDTTHISKINNNKKHVKLEAPKDHIIFQNNHLLIINKPAGWHCQPNESPSSISNTGSALSTKCLVTQLKNDQLGGGSDNSFLLPVHRIDQPCTGATLLAKTSKAGSRVAKAWRDGLVTKDYYCVVEGDLARMMANSSNTKSKGKQNVFLANGILSQRRNSRSVNVRRVNKNNMNMMSAATDTKNGKKQRVCEIEWQLILSLRDGKHHLVRVITNTGARHQVRAMLSQIVGSPVAGDLRYGASSALPDQSVALHARSILLNNIQLGKTDFNKPFIAPVPRTWSQFFGILEHDLIHNNKSKNNKTNKDIRIIRNSNHHDHSNTYASSTTNDDRNKPKRRKKRIDG